MSGSGRLPARKPPAGRARAVIRGLLLLGTGRAEGFEYFEASRDAFLAGLAPQIGFLLVLSALLLVQHPTVPALCLVMLLLSVLLQMGLNRAVVSEAVLLLLGGYLIWLQWFMAWKGLAISRLKAGVTVVALLVGSSLLGAALQPLLMQVMAVPEQVAPAH